MGLNKFIAQPQKYLFFLFIGDLVKGQMFRARVRHEARCARFCISILRLTSKGGVAEFFTQLL